MWFCFPFSRALSIYTDSHTWNPYHPLNHRVAWWYCWSQWCWWFQWWSPQFRRVFGISFSCIWHMAYGILIHIYRYNIKTPYQKNLWLICSYLFQICTAWTNTGYIHAIVRDLGSTSIHCDRCFQPEPFHPTTVKRRWSRCYWWWMWFLSGAAGKNTLTERVSHMTGSSWNLTTSFRPDFWTSFQRNQIWKGLKRNKDDIFERDPPSVLLEYMVFVLQRTTSCMPSGRWWCWSQSSGGVAFQPPPKKDEKCRDKKHEKKHEPNNGKLI